MRLGVPGLNDSTFVTNPLAAEWNPGFPTPGHIPQNQVGP